jgi:hypothetical protein
MSQRIRWYLLIGVVFLIALIFRVWGINNGLPHVQRPDEVGDIAQALQIVQGETPHYAYHRVAWSMVQIPLHGLHFVFQRLTQPDYSLADFEASYYLNRHQFILTTRIYLAIFTALACVIVGFTAYKITGDKRVFVLSALALAVYPPHVYLSHIALPDAFSTFAVALCLLNVVLMIQTRKPFTYALAGAAAALAMLARLQVLPLVIVPIAVAHVIAWWTLPSRSWRFLLLHWLWAFAGFIIGHLLFNPFILFEPQAVWRDLQFIFNERFTGTNNWQPEYATFRPAANLLGNLDLPLIFLRPYGIVLFMLATVTAIIKRNTVVLVMCFTGCLFIASLLPTTIPRITFWLPAVIPMSVAIGWSTIMIWQSKQQTLRYAALIIFVGFFVLALIETVKIDTTLAQPDTQSLAYDYITRELSPGTKILIGDTFVYSVPLERNQTSIERLRDLKPLPASYQFFLANPNTLPTPVYDIYGYEYISQIQSDAEMLAFINENQIEYIIETDYCGGSTPYELTSGLTFPAITETVRASLNLVYMVSPFVQETCVQHIENRTHMEYMRLWDWARVGPVISAYEIKELE